MAQPYISKGGLERLLDTLADILELCKPAIQKAVEEATAPKPKGGR